MFQADAMAEWLEVLTSKAKKEKNVFPLSTRKKMDMVRR